MYRVPVRIQDCAENKSKAQRVWITKYLQDTMASLFVYLLNAHNCPAEIWTLQNKYLDTWLLGGRMWKLGKSLMAAVAAGGWLGGYLLKLDTEAEIRRGNFQNSDSSKFNTFAYFIVDNIL